MEFPREFGLKRTIVNNKTELINLINKCNKICLCNISLYKITEGELLINNVFFDVDGNNSNQYMKQLHNEFIKENLKHIINYSGKGYHLYLKIKPFSAKQDSYSAKTKIKYIQELYCEKANVPIGDGIDMDCHIVGNIRAMARLTNTFNIKRNRYCIPVNDINADHKKIAENQCYDFTEFGDNLLDNIKVPEDYIFKNKFFEDVEYVVDENSSIEPYIDLLKNEVKNKLHLCGYKERFNLIMNFKGSGIPKNIAIKIAQKYWNKQKFKHSVYEERQFDYIYKRNDLLMPKM